MEPRSRDYSKEVIFPLISLLLQLWELAKQVNYSYHFLPVRTRFSTVKNCYLDFAQKERISIR
jgi:hypothetical protein